MNYIHAIIIDVQNNEMYPTQCSGKEEETRLEIVSTSERNHFQLLVSNFNLNTTKRNNCYHQKLFKSI